MAKAKTVYVCQNCGVDSPKWVGKCFSCGEWNTFTELKLTGSSASKPLKTPSNTRHTKPVPIQDVESETKPRIHSGINELDRILGGGIVPGSLILLGGEPGIGKSTLALQIALKSDKIKILYISGEESNEQIKLRADRIGINNPRCFVLGETILDNILSEVENIQPDLLIIDSIQTLYKESLDSGPGSITQVRDCTVDLLKVCKSTGIPALIIGHINKEGSIAGPKILEHIVDTVLQFEGDMNHMYRIIRVIKNRFGASSELAIFEMNEKGLREIINPSEILITKTDDELSGVTIAATIDGNRPFLIETQSLVSSAVYGTPQRSTTGYDIRRLNMLLAVLEKKAGFNIASKDVFLNIAGGLKITDPALDLAIIIAILSSSVDLPINKKYCFAGEIGLSGEIRPVSKIIQRIKEAEKIGFEKIFISTYNKKNIPQKDFNIKIGYLSKVDDLVKGLFQSYKNR